MERKEVLKRALKELIQARMNLDHGQKNGVPPEQMAALREKVEYRELVVEALRQMPHGEPLTLEQLREMDGKPVWIDTGNQYSDWGKVDFKRFRVWPFGQEDAWWDFGHYGEWKPYAYPPSHIDREAWEPCGNCKTCENCQNSGDYDPYEGYFGECGSCDVKTHSNFSPVHFCHDCGRPLTPEAWAMLEKRFRG